MYANDSISYDGDYNPGENISEFTNHCSSAIERFTWIEGGAKQEEKPEPLFPQIRVLDPMAGIDENKSYISEFNGEESLRHSILQELFGWDFCEDMVSVKLPTFQRALELKERPDGVEREIAFSTGSQAFLLRPDAKSKVDQFFVDSPESATRYGSLLTTDCYKGTHRLYNVVVRVVDFENPEHRNLYAVGDCRGLISKRLCSQLKISYNKPFQFRMAWLKEWEMKTEKVESLGKSFLAKGTLAVKDTDETSAEAVDIILDQSSIKGNKIKCGFYRFPELVLGVKSVAKISSYKNSWQINQWLSQEAIENDILPTTIEKAIELAEIQDTPRTLINSLIEEEKSKYRDEDEPEGVLKIKMLSILEADRWGQLETHPKTVTFLTEQTTKMWMDLAVNGGIRHFAGLAQPDYRLSGSQVCIPELPHGEQIIVTRYPIVNSDGIRKYVNVHLDDLKGYQGCVFINPETAMENHQCDFDGDMLVFNLRENLPTAWYDILWGSSPPDWEPIKKRQKIPYQGSLAQIAIEQQENMIGLLANAVGQVQCSKSNAIKLKRKETGQVEQFTKERILNELFDALQIEVDSPKSALRFHQIYPHLLDVCGIWSKLNPVSLFQNKSDSRVFRTTPGVWDKKTSYINIIGHTVSNLWQKSRLFQEQTNSFDYLFPSYLDSSYQTWALATLSEYHENRKAIVKNWGSDKKQLLKKTGKLYEDLRNKRVGVFEAAAVLWRLQHSKKVKQTEQASLTFNLFDDFIKDQLLEMPKECFVIGKVYNDFKDYRFKGEDITLEVRKVESDDPKYMDRPGLFIGEQFLGFFGGNYPRFGLGTTIYCKATDQSRTRTKLEIQHVKMSF